MNRWSLILLVLGLTLWSSSPLQADDHIKGRYLVSSYTARQYNAGTQNWDIVQDSKGIIYIANRNGVLIYDGFDWLLTPNSLETPLRSIAITHDDVVYAGSVGEFGVLEADSIGNPVYRSLSSGLEDVIADVWETHATSTHVYFATRNKIYVLNLENDQLSTVPSPQNAFQRSFKVHDSVFAGVPNRGLFEIKGDSLIRLAGLDTLTSEVVNSILEAPVFSGSEMGLFILTNSRKTFHYGLDTQIMTRIDEDNGSEYKIPAQTYRARNLRNGDFMFATLSNGVVITDSMFNIKHVINREHGLMVDMTLNVMEDRDGSIWAALNNGLSRVDFHNNILSWNTDSEFTGGVFYVPKEAYETKSGQLNQDGILSLTESNGLSTNTDNYVSSSDDGQIILISHNGVFNLSSGDSVMLSMYLDFGQINLQNIKQISRKSPSERFVLTDGELFNVSEIDENEHPSVVNLLPFLRREPFNVMKLIDSTQVWLGSTDALFKVNLNEFPSFDKPFHSIIHAVYLNQDSLLSRNLIGEARVLSIPFGQANVTFQYGSTRTIYGYTPRFESMLEGYDENWSAWSSEKNRTYTNLSNGRYTFKVRSLDPFGNISQVGTVVIIVPTPWFKSMFAYMMYAILLIAITYGIVRFQTDRIARQNRLLEKKVIQRTAELQVEKRRLETMNDNLKALDENRDKFLSVVAHDLRNPLMIIRSSSDLIEEEIKDKNAILEFAGYIRDASVKMQNIIENLLEDRAKKIRLHGDIPVIDVKPIVAKICKENEIWAQSKGIELKLELADGCFIKADGAHIGVIIDNLVANAIKYSSQDKQIDISLVRTKSDQVEITITDQGPGLLTSEIQKIGKPSVKLSAQPTGGESSSGMGLFIVKDLLQSNNGDLSIYSAGRGKGSTFKVIFPVSEMES